MSTEPLAPTASLLELRTAALNRVSSQLSELRGLLAAIINNATPQLIDVEPDEGNEDEFALYYLIHKELYEVAKASLESWGKGE